MRSNIKTSLSRLIPIAVLALLDNVIAKMIGNLLFPAPPTPYAVAQTLSTQLRDAIDDATGGGIIARKHRDMLLRDAKALLRNYADYVRSVCNGQEELLVQSGFPMSKQPAPVNVVGIPPQLVAVPTDSPSELRLRWKHTVGAVVFRAERATSDPISGTAKWEIVNITARQSIVISGLEPYAPNWFRVVAIGRHGEGLPSDVVLGRAA